MSAGRPPYEPTDDQRRMVMVAAGMGINQELIASRLGIAKDTLAKHFRSELDHGRDIANMQVADSLFRQAVSGRVPAATFFWLKTQAGWRERVEITGADGAPLHPKEDLSRLSTAELREFQRLARRAENEPVEED